MLYSLGRAIEYALKKSRTEKSRRTSALDAVAVAVDHPREWYRRINNIDRKPAMFYFHPWEIDPGQPRVEGPGAKTRFRHYVNLKHMKAKLQRLVNDFDWDRADRIFLSEPG